MRWYIDTPIKTAVLTTGNFRQLKTRLTWEIQANNWPNPQKNLRSDAYSIKEKGRSEVEATECPYKKTQPTNQVTPVRLIGWVSKVPCLGKPDD